MKRTSLWKRGIGLLLVSALLAAAAAALAGCGTDIIPSGTAQLGNLTEGLTPNKVTVNVDMDEQSVLITDFALRLLRASRREGESTLVSPLSVLYALAMTANGAEGETKGQIESALGLRIEELNEYLYGYNVMLPQGWNSKIGIANSIWLNEAKQTSVKADFLQANVDYLRADVYRVPFDDKTCADINGWVKEATDGLMPNMLDEVSSEAIVYLINALVFESPWFEPYKPEQVEPGVFTTEDDVKRKASFMYSTEEEYFSDGVTVGFAKTFDRDYAFVALLPDEHLRMDEFLDSLTGESLQDLLATSRRVKVNASLPKFSTESGTNLIEALSDMGISRLFDPAQAELGGIGPGGLYIDRVLHETYLTVDEYGCRAGASTSVSAILGVGPDGEPKTVYLDRPFVYMIVDAKYRVPLFIGTMMDPTVTPDAD